MGFAFEDGTGLPVTVDPQHPGVQQAVAPLALHDADGHTAQPETAVRVLHVQPEPVLQPAPSPESEIGGIMLQLQRYADETTDDAERKAQAILASAHAQATEIIRQAGETAGSANAIVQAAHAEAQAIVDQARHHAAELASRIRPPISPETVYALSTAIEEFANTNRTLVAELTQLRHALAESYTAGLEYQAPQPLQIAPPHGYAQPVTGPPQEYLNGSAS